MTIETEVAALTVATTSLLGAITVSKTALDAKVDAVTAIGAQVGQVSVVTASGNITLTAASPTYQLINPNGAARNVTLPALSGTDRVVFAVKNTGTGGFALNIKASGGTAVGVPIANGYSLTLVWAGTQWEVM